MPVSENIYSISHLLGNTEVPKSANPILRSAARRLDPDGTSTAPYYAGVAGQILSIEYTDAASVVQTENITIASNSYSAIITQINAVDSANLEALDQDGFLALRNLNAGESHYIKILPQGVLANEAAGLLGFIVDPFPGSVSYAGEYLSAPSARTQGNPQGTSLVSKNEDLTSQSVNRAVFSALRFAERNRIDLDREVLTVEKVAVTLANNSTVAAADGVPGGQQAAVANVFTLNDPTLRIPVGLFTSADPGALALEEIFKLIVNGSDVVFNVDSGGPRFRIRSVHYSTTPATPNFRDAAQLSNTFAVWGTPDNRSIFGSAAALHQMAKHPATAITEITANIIKCTGATFETDMVQPGDTCRITGATNTAPFDHNGEYIVETVWDEETISVRAKNVSDPNIFGDPTPTELNPTGSGLGSVTILIGHYLPASNLVFTIEDVGGTSWSLLTASPGTFELLLKVGRPFREAVARKLARDFSVSPDKVREYIQSHVDDTSSAHAASAIAWTAAQPTWTPTGESITGSNVQTLIQQILTMLGDAETVSNAETGAGRIGSAAVTGDAPDNIPRSLAAGSVRTQLKLLVEYLNNHMNDGVAHAGAGALYSGSPPWADTTTIPAGVTIDAAIDQIVSDLAATTVGDDGAGKVGIRARTNWLGGRTNVASNVFAAIDKIITDLAATTAADDGAERIGAAIRGTGNTLPAGSIASQLVELADNWGKLSRAQTWSARQTLNGSAGDTNAALDTTSVPVTRKLLWEVNLLGSRKGRIYAGAGASGAGWEFTVNALWNGAAWDADDDTTASSRVVFSAGEILWGSRAAGAGTWADSAWNNVTLGTPLFGTNAQAETARLTMPRDTVQTRILLFAFPGIAGTHGIRVYRSNHTTESLEITSNAVWDADTSTWAKEAAANTSILVRINRARLELRRRSTTAGTWTDDDTGWDEGLPIEVTTTIPSHTAAEGPMVCPKNVVRAHGRCRNMGDNSTDMDTAFEEGFNANPASTHDGTSMTITFPEPLSNNDYTVVMLADFNGESINALPSIFSKGSSSFEVVFRSLASPGLIISLSGTVQVDLYYVILGE